MSDSLRIDKWLWHARFFKSRTLAAKFISEGKLRINQTRISKAARLVLLEDVLTFTKAERTYIIEIVALGTRRGPAPEAQALYEDITPSELNECKAPHGAAQIRKGGRPNKHERKQLTALKRQTTHE